MNSHHQTGPTAAAPLATPTFALKPLALALLALFVGPAAAQTIIADKVDVIQVTGDQIASTRYQIGKRDTSNAPQQNLANTSLTFSISQDVTLTINGMANTNANTYLGSGGAINVNVPGNPTATGNSGSPLRFTDGGNLVFSDNSSLISGGAVGAYFTTTGHASVFDFTGLGSLAFRGNITGTAGSGYGGGIFSYATGSDSSVTLGNNVTFTGNIAGKQSSGTGGGINSASVTLGSHVLFRGNRAGGGAGAQGVGGAIYAAQNVTLAGHSLFEGNVTGGTGAQGGAAIHLGTGTGTLNTGDDPNAAIAFRENYNSVTVNPDGTWDTSGGTANSIYMGAGSQLLLMGAGNIYFDDPIRSGTGGGNRLTRAGSGFVQFAGNSRLNTSSISGNSVDIQSGAFRIVQGASFDASGGGAFNVGSEATLAGGGTIAANSFALSGTLAPDSDHLEIPTFDANHTFATGRDTVDADKLIGTLTLEGNVDITSAELHFDTQLGDDSSPTDKVVITGTVSGTAQIVITPVSPSQGASTGTGIVLVEASDSTSDDAFELSGSPLIVGHYAYTLSVSESSGRKFFVLKSEPYAAGGSATAIPALPAPLLLALALLLPAGVFAIRRREFPQE